MNDNSLQRKLGIKPGQRLLVLNAPDGYRERLLPLPEGTTLDTAADGAYDFVHAFVRNGAELDVHGPTALAAAKRDGLLWFSYPKRSAKVATDLTRDAGWDLLRQAGFEGIAQVAIDDVWAATRFRPSELVKHR